MSLIFVVLLAHSAFGLPLVFTTTKEIKTAKNQTFTELVSFDTSKYKQMRIGIVYGGPWSNADGTLIPVFARIEAIENTDAFVLHEYRLTSDRTASVDNPTTKTRISATNSGTYKIYVWAN